MKLTLILTSTIVLFFLTSCQKDEMDKGGAGSGVQDNQIMIQKNAIGNSANDSLDLDLRTNDTKR